MNCITIQLWRVWSYSACNYLLANSKSAFHTSWLLFYWIYFIWPNKRRSMGYIISISDRTKSVDTYLMYLISLNAEVTTSLKASAGLRRQHQPSVCGGTELGSCLIFIRVYYFTSQLGPLLTSNGLQARISSVQIDRAYVSQRCANRAIHYY